MNKHVLGMATDIAAEEPLERTHSGRFTELDADKLRGGYYTSSELARWLCAWAIRDAGEMVLEPSCGDGSFLEAASARLEALGAKGPARANHLRGIEIIAGEADKARMRLKDGLGMRADDVVVKQRFLCVVEPPGPSEIRRSCRQPAIHPLSEFSRAPSQPRNGYHA